MNDGETAKDTFSLFSTFKQSSITSGERYKQRLLKMACRSPCLTKYPELVLFFSTHKFHPASETHLQEFPFLSRFTLYNTALIPTTFEMWVDFGQNKGESMVTEKDG